MQVQGQLFKRSVTALLRQCATEKTRYAIHGVSCAVDGTAGDLVLVATDGRRLAELRLAVHTRASMESELSGFVYNPIIVQGKAMREFLKGIKGRGNVDVQALWGLDQIEGHFPKYQDIIPPDGGMGANVPFSFQGRLDTNPWDEAVQDCWRRDSLVVLETSEAIDADDQNTVEVRALKGSHLGHILCNGQLYQRHQSGFNGDYVLDSMALVKAIGCKAYTFQQDSKNEGKGACRPCRIDSVGAGVKAVQVVMPVSLS